jgi:DNA-binding HxlR family transcriptional regulator
MNEKCPASELLKALNGKWKAQIFKMASEGPVRFSQILKALPDANKQSVTVALRELESSGFLLRNVIREKPLIVEYQLTERGKLAISLFASIEEMIES